MESFEDLCLKIGIYSHRNENKKICEYKRSSVVLWLLTPELSHFDNIKQSPQKPLGQFGNQISYKASREFREWKLCSKVQVTWPTWPPCPYMFKTFENLFHQNQLTDGLRVTYPRVLWLNGFRWATGPMVLLFQLVWVETGRFQSWHCKFGAVCRNWYRNVIYVNFYRRRVHLNNRLALAVNCWVIIHCLEVSCKVDHTTSCLEVSWKVDHTTSAEREWYIYLQLTDKQWIISQQFNARAELFRF